MQGSYILEHCTTDHKFFPSFTNSPADCFPIQQSKLTPQTIANKSGIAHKSAKTLKFKLDANLLKIKHGVNKFKLTALRDFWTERFKNALFRKDPAAKTYCYNFER